MEHTLDPNHHVSEPSDSYPLLGKKDPILQELWAIKAQLNKDSHYSVHERRKQVQGLSMAAARLQLGMA